MDRIVAPLAEVAASKLPVQPRLETNSYCMHRVPGGLAGLHICGTPIPIKEQFCSDCKKMMEQ